MIPNEQPQTIETAGFGVKVIGSFKITDATQARILVSLSDKMYTRKELAVVREYSNNANDAHIVAGKPTSEVLVTLPILTDLTFRVRDFGSGLTEEQIRDVYCILGESTKRNSASQNGVLGYGCKAGFAHADSFTVTSWINGEKSVYNCIKGDSTKLHSAILLSRCASDEPSGIEINVPVKQSSVWTFHREAADFFKYWENLPTIINMDSSHTERMMKFRNTAPTLKGEGWNIRPKCDGSAVGVAFMGGVAYRIDWNVLQTRMALDSKKRVLFDLLQNNDVTLFYGMSEVQFVDSREGLEYTDLTLQALMARIESIFVKIKDSIQEKFTPALDLWEAKIIYNAIFGTGVLEVEKGESSDCVEKIKILEGNLMSLEHTFGGDFTWNGVVLNNAGFYDLNRFDNDSPAIICSKHHNPLAPVMVTYRRKKKRAKINRCTADNNNDIIASNQVAVVLNDTGLKSGQAAVARYLIFRDNSRIRTVHILTFADNTIKDNFYKEYSFDSVPTIKLSEVLVDAKAWVAANRTPRNYTSNGGSGGVRVMRYMDIVSGYVHENDVPIRDMEDGGIYIKAGEGRRHCKDVQMGNGYSHESPDNVVEYLKVLVEKAGLDLDRVYIINNHTSESKWFKQAIESGDWTNLWEYLKENLTVDMNALVEANAYHSSSTVCKKVAEKLVPLVMDKNSQILKLINVVSGKNYDESLALVSALQELQLWANLKEGIASPINFAEVATTTQTYYPFLNFGNLNSEYYADQEEYMTKISRYINASDLYEKLQRHGLLSAVIDSDCDVNPSDSCPSTTAVAD